MKVLQVHNWHRFGGGADLIAKNDTLILRRREHEVLFISRDSRKLGRGLLGRIHAFACGAYSASGRSIITGHIRKFEPDIVHVHELYPFFSPWILLECKRAGVPVIMTCHDYRLTCATYQHLSKGKVCELCANGHEYWCVLKNCRDNIFESFAYAIWKVIARKLQLFYNNVSVFIAGSQFAKARLSAAGFAEERIAILPNMVSGADLAAESSTGDYGAYVGRISPEKGLDIVLAAASLLPELNVQVAGEGQTRCTLAAKAPQNVKFIGALSRERIASFYRHARFIVVPSKWFEMCPLVISEAMSHGLPVIASNIGGLPELVDDDVTGLLFEPGNPEDLADKMKQLWENPNLCRKMGQAGREKSIREYSEDIYYERLIGFYEKALALDG